MNIVAFSGSLRKHSYNTMLLKAFQAVAPDDVHISIIDISALPPYNQDEETSYPAAAKAVKDKVLAADAVIFATPEYNRSMPGVLKNAIDWVSRPYGTNAFAGKVVLVTGVSGGKIGTALAQNHLRQVMLYLDTHVLGQPELYFGPAAELFNEQGEVIGDGLNEVLQKALTALKKATAK